MHPFYHVPFTLCTQVLAISEWLGMGRGNREQEEGSAGPAGCSQNWCNVRVRARPTLPSPLLLGLHYVASLREPFPKLLILNSSKSPKANSPELKVHTPHGCPSFHLDLEPSQDLPSCHQVLKRPSGEGLYMSISHPKSWVFFLGSSY